VSESAPPKIDILAQHNAEVLAEKERKKFLDSLPRITLPQLEWLSAGFHAMSDEQQVAWLKQEIAKDVAGQREPPMTGVQMKGAISLLNKLIGDKKVAEVTHTHVAQELSDDELDSRIARYLGKAGIAGSAGGTGEATKPQTAH
jgi:hypothetical protein